MVARSEPCDGNRLRLLLQDRLPEAGQRDVEKHVQVCRRCQAALDRLAGGDDWWSDVREYLTPDDLAVPSRELRLDFLTPTDEPGTLGLLGPYKVTGILGRGGMGAVLKAFDPGLHRPVAIKVMAAELAVSGAARKRFAREAQAAAAVEHEHVVPVHAVNADASLPYLVMAYVQGKSLQERLDREGPLGVREILRIGMQTASGLAAAHAQGLVHRDVKPANILLENGVERVRLTDFGLARAVDDVTVTQSGVVAGTPQYMSPEQARGEAVDHRADLFGLGSTMYAMCTGYAPFRGDTAWAVLRRVCEEQPQAIRQINPDVPGWLVAIVGRLHAKNPAERFQSAAEVAALLERCLAHVQQPDAVPLPPVPRGPRSAVRTFSWIGAGLAAIGVVVGAASALDRWNNGRKIDDRNGDQSRALADDSSGTQEVKAAAPTRVFAPMPVAPDKAAREIGEQVGRLNSRVDELRRDWTRPSSGRPDYESSDPLDDVRRRIREIAAELGVPEPSTSPR